MEHNPASLADHDPLPIDLPVRLETNPILIQSMSKFLQAQTNMLLAQAQAVAIQGLPPMKKFSGEFSDHEEDGFDKWCEVFEERTHLAGWTEELKVHFEHTALQVFNMIPESSRKVYLEVSECLKKRFKPVDIEELKGIEFHQKMQGSNETIEQLGLKLQKLGSKAFPGTTGKEFDRLLKEGSSRHYLVSGKGNLEHLSLERRSMIGQGHWKGMTSNSLRPVERKSLQLEVISRKRPPTRLQKVVGSRHGKIPNSDLGLNAASVRE